MDKTTGCGELLGNPYLQQGPPETLQMLLGPGEVEAKALGTQAENVLGLELWEASAGDLGAAQRHEPIGRRDPLKLLPSNVLQVFTQACITAWAGVSGGGSQDSTSQSGKTEMMGTVSG